MTLVDRHFRPLDVDAAAAALRAMYRIDAAALRPLPGERTQNFHVRSARDGEFVFKICPHDEALERLRCQHAAMLHVQRHAQDVDVPAPIADIGGETLPLLSLPDVDPLRVRVLRFVPGRELGTIPHHGEPLLTSIGALLGRVDRALDTFTHPAALQDFAWDLAGMPQVVREHIDEVTDPARRELVDSVRRRFEKFVAPRLSGLRRSVIHNDGNDYNVLVDGPGTPDTYRAIGLIDFGDILQTHTVFEPAIAAAYAMLKKTDPVAAAAQVAAGYHAELPLEEGELELFFDLARARLCLSVVIAAYQRRRAPDNAYLSITEPDAWDALSRLTGVHPNLAHYRIRAACGLPPFPEGPRIVRALRAAGPKAHAIIRPDPAASTSITIDLSPASEDLTTLTDLADPRSMTELVCAKMAEAGAEVAIGRYDEPRLWYADDLFADPDDVGGEHRTIHVGLDLFAPPGTPVRAPLDGVIHSFRNNTANLDYGPTIVLQHVLDLDDGPVAFHTLYGHLTADSLEGKAPGQAVAAGAAIGAIGNFPENGNWAPHLHLQVIGDMLGLEGDFPGVAAPHERRTWTSLCPDPSPLLRLASAPDGAWSADAIARARHERVGPSLSLAYDRPLHIVCGRGQYLYDVDAREYLDLVNNVCHVGHCHPHVVAAGSRQMALLNTNTRYLHEHLVAYADRLCATMPDGLDVCYFVCSGSEANELALRLARTYTGRRGIAVLDAAYHGNTSALVDLSPYKHAGPGGAGPPEWVHTLELPDRYRGRHRGDDCAAQYVADAASALSSAAQSGAGLAALFAESAPGCGGQIILPDGYLSGVFQAARRAGGVCVADEVQVGFGRVGTHWWAFQTQGVTPDIVTLGKPIGNGHPIGAVVTTREIADAFDNGMEYFNTFGGNPVSCAIGMAVLDVIEREHLREHARDLGTHILGRLKQLQGAHPVMGDVRGLGLYLGIEMVADPDARTPAPDVARYVVGRMRERGILLSTDGPDHNVIKFKPPMVLTRADADRFVLELEKVVREVAKTGEGRRET